MFKDQKHIVDTAQELKVYQQHNNSEENLGYVQMFEDFMQQTFMPYQDKIKDVLDFGSGPTPVLASLLAKKGFRTDHYDKFFAPEKCYEEKTYDLITSTEVIEHIYDVHEVMDLFYRHLRQGGFLALMTQFHPTSQEAYLKWWYRRDPTHISFFTPKTFQVLAKEHGFMLLFNDNKKLILLQKK